MKNSVLISTNLTKNLLEDFEILVDKGFEPDSVKIIFKDSIGKYKDIRTNDVNTVSVGTNVIYPDCKKGEFYSIIAFIKQNLIYSTLFSNYGVEIFDMDEIEFKGGKFRINNNNTLDVFIPSFERFVESTPIFTFAENEKYRNLLLKNCRHIHDIYNEGVSIVTPIIEELMKCQNK